MSNVELDVGDDLANANEDVGGQLDCELFAFSPPPFFFSVSLEQVHLWHTADGEIAFVFSFWPFSKLGECALCGLLA